MTTWRSRSWLGRACLLWPAAFLVAGCTDHGSYHVSWTFMGDDATAEAGCGLTVSMRFA